MDQQRYGGHSAIDGVQNKSFGQSHGPWGSGRQKVQGAGLRVQKYLKKYLLSEGGKKCFQDFPHFPQREASPELPENNLYPRPQMKRPRNEGTMARKAKNMLEA